MSGDYDASQIQVLSGLEAVRRRPGMYVGPTDERAVAHLVGMLVQNGIAAHRERGATRLDAQLGPVGFAVRVDGELPPLDADTLERTFTVLHSSGHVASWMPVVTALSSVLVATVDRGRRYQQTFVRGEPVTGLVDVGPAPGAGLGIWFVPDVGVLQTDRLDRRAMREELGELAVLVPDLAIHVDGIAVPSHGGLLGYARHLAGPDVRRAWSTRVRDEGVEVEVAVVWGEGGTLERGWANHLPCGGSHVDGLRRGLAHTDPRGRVALVSAWLAEPQFVGQTKDRVHAPGLADLVEDAVRGL